ncbi:PAS domain S-box protein [Verrucomicrobium sp. BvORR034]|uniref:sensor histidine kinase n=1 Tax=Verrucomicrobium sp. BvORR034 TaxID=1396418 RepID=UPI0006795AF2|nr:PAS domain S-box protein [Verrucomicrobium sp. BvORR034]
MPSDVAFQTEPATQLDPGLAGLIFQQHPDAVLLVDLSGRFLEANEAACQLAGWSRVEILEMRPWQLLPTTSPLEVREWLRSRSRDATETFVLTLAHRLGHVIRVEARVRRVASSDRGDCLIVSCRELPVKGDLAGSPESAAPVPMGSPAHLQQQLVQLRQHNKSLIEAEERLRLAMELGGLGLWIWQATPDSNPGHWSDRLKEIFGVPLDAEVTHDMFLTAVHPEDREKVDAAVKGALMGQEGGRYALEYRTLRPEATGGRWVLARGQAFFDEAGAPVRFIGSVLDITERKRAEEALAQLNNGLGQRIEERTAELETANRALTREIEERRRAEETLRRNKDNLRLVIDTIPGLVWSSLPDGNIEYLNKRWLDYTGLTLDQASGWGWQTAIHPDDLDRLVTYWKSIIAEGVAGDIEARLRHHSGAYRWFIFRGVPLYDAEGKVVKWYGTNTDVEERRKSEHLARGQISALTQTLSAVSREANPDRLLAHVLCVITSTLNAHSLGVWQKNKETAVVKLVASWEGGELHLTTVDESEPQSLNKEGDAPHPIWTDFFATGIYCVAGDWNGGDIRVQTLDGTDGPWYPWHADAVENPNVPIVVQRLLDQGVQSTLVVPMLLAGRVTGFLSIRFTRPPQFQTEEIELAQALAHQVMLALQLIRLTQEGHRLAVLAERNRMARELHDTLAQGITAVIMQLELAEDAAARGLMEDVDPHLKRARELARQTLRDARRSVRAMRPQALKAQDLPQALSALFKQMTEGTGLQAEVTLRGDPYHIPNRCEENILRIGQEVLTNAIRHAGASRFTGRLIFSAPAIRLHLHDNGRGFDPDQQHDGFGLTGIRERVEGMGGRLCLRSKPGRGTSISIRLGRPKAESGTFA